MRVSVQVGYPADQDGRPSTIRSIAICAGSGGSMLAGQDADLYLTGEMSHVRVIPNFKITTHKEL